MNVKDRMLERIRDRALEEARYLAGEFARAASEEREAILAGLEFERWLAQAADEALEDPSGDGWSESESGSDRSPTTTRR